MLLESLPPGVVTVTGPLEAPEGTLVVISVAETTVKVAGVPLNVTAVEPVRLLPSILTTEATFPEVGSVFTKGPSPIDSLKTLPDMDPPPAVVVP